MADKKKSGIGVVPEFVAGEQPSADKFNAIGVQVRRGLYELEKAVGDILSESHPYSSSSGTYLTQRWGRANNNTSLSLQGANGRPLSITNLARLIGPASNLNPMILGHLDSSAGENVIDGEAVPVGVHQFTLRYVPDTTANIDSTGQFITFSDTTVFGNAVPLGLLGNAGDYHVDSTGTVSTVSATTSSTTCKYAINSNKWRGGPAYLGASFNEIPDPNQVNENSTAKITLAQQADGTYHLTLPVVTHQQANYGDTSSVLTESNDVNTGVQLLLPAVLTDSFITGDVIPEGFIYLRNNTTNETYTDAVYRYNSEKVLNIGSVELPLSDSYSILTIGTDITTSIDDIRKKLFTHSHNRAHGESPINVADLDGATSVAGASGAFTLSAGAGNYFPQYLHRDGFRTTDLGNINDANCMRGDLVIGSKYTDTGDTTLATAGNYLQSVGGSSFKLRFGYFTDASAPYIYDNPSTGLTIKNEGGDVTIDASSEVDIDAGTDARITAADDITLTAADDVFIYASDLANIAANNTVNITATTGNVNIAATVSGKTTIVADRQGHAVTIENLNTTVQADALELLLGTETSGSAGLGPSNRFVSMYAKNTGSYVGVGAITGAYNGNKAFVTTNSNGAIQDSAASTQMNWSSFLLNILTNSSLKPDPIVTNFHGAVQYVSGAADFGEWLMIGDLDEWESTREECLSSIIERGSWGLEEGRLVYVRECRIYRYGPGTPMLVTNRALCVGNAQIKLVRDLDNDNTLARLIEDTEARYQKEPTGELKKTLEQLRDPVWRDSLLKCSYAGEVISFIGQLPVIVKGNSTEGDYILPVDNEPYCVARPASDISFEEYRKAIGTVWETIELADGQTFGKPLCAIGIK